jgi:hypothetical protein
MYLIGYKLYITGIDPMLYKKSVLLQRFQVVLGCHEVPDKVTRLKVGH